METIDSDDDMPPLEEVFFLFFSFLFFNFFVLAPCALAACLSVWMYVCACVSRVLVEGFSIEGLGLVFSVWRRLIPASFSSSPPFRLPPRLPSRQLKKMENKRPLSEVPSSPHAAL